MNIQADVSPRDRLRWVTRTMTVSLLALVLLVVALVVGVTWTFGLFSSTSANPGSLVASGSMSQANSAGDAAIMTARDLVPGSRVEGTVELTNVGDAVGDFRLSVAEVVDTPGPRGGELSGRLHLTVHESGTDGPVFSGPLDRLDASLGQWQPGETHTFDFVVELPESSDGTDDDYQHSKVTATFVWDAIQSH